MIEAYYDFKIPKGRIKPIFKRREFVPSEFWILRSEPLGFMRDNLNQEVFVTRLSYGTDGNGARVIYKLGNPPQPPEYSAPEPWEAS